jgi:hypothetical protein
MDLFEILLARKLGGGSGGGGGGNITDIAPLITITYEGVQSTICNDDGFLIPQENNTVIVSPTVDSGTFKALYRYSTDAEDYYVTALTDAVTCSDFINCYLNEENILCITNPTINSSVSITVIG